MSRATISASAGFLTSSVQVGQLKAYVDQSARVQTLSRKSFGFISTSPQVGHVARIIVMCIPFQDAGTHFTKHKRDVIATLYTTYAICQPLGFGERGNTVN
jgi:hypothetical protein